MNAQNLATSETASTDKDAANANSEAIPTDTGAGHKRTSSSIAYLAKLLLQVTGWLVLLAFVSTFFCRWLFEAELLGNFRLQMGLLTLFWFGIACVMGQSWLRLGLAFATLWNAWLVGAGYLPANQPVAGPQIIKVMSYNIFAAAEDFDTVQRRVEEINPDVLILVEYDYQWYLGLQELEQQYPHRLKAPRWHGFGIAVFSKYPLENKRVYQLINHVTDTPLPVADVVVGEQRFRLFGVHVLSPTNRTRLKYRNQQYLEMADLIKQCEIPALAIGDFNSTSWSPYIQNFLSETGMRDSRNGFGYQPTWHREYWPIRVPIDNAFVSSKIHVHQRFVGAGSASDHFPIILNISVAE